MATAYRLVGAQDPASRIDRWKAESPSDDYPDGKTLVLGGKPVELTEDQYAIGSRFLRLEPVSAEQQETQPVLIDQPGVALPSLSTDVPPEPGTLPDIDEMNNEQLRSEAERIGADVSGKRSNEDIKSAIKAKREEG